MTITTSSRSLTLWGTALITVVGLIHLFVVPEYFEIAAYLGVAMLVNFFGSIAAAFGIYRDEWWGWPLGALMAGGAFLMYVESRTIGLPGLHEGWLDPPGVLSLIVEAIFVALYLRGTSRSRIPGRE